MKGDGSQWENHDSPGVGDMIDQYWMDVFAGVGDGIWLGGRTWWNMIDPQKNNIPWPPGQVGVKMWEEKISDVILKKVNPKLPVALWIFDRREGIDVHMRFGILDRVPYFKCSGPNGYPKRPSTRTPNFYKHNLTITNSVAHDLVTIEGKNRNATFFGDGGIIRHREIPNVKLPITLRNELFTIHLSFSVLGTDQVDKVLFSEGCNNLRAGNHERAEFSIRTIGDGSKKGLITIKDHDGLENISVMTDTDVFDGTWRTITYVQGNNGERKFYVDGVLDVMVIPNKHDDVTIIYTDRTCFGALLHTGNIGVPDTHITGWLYSAAMWDRALSENEIVELSSPLALESIFSTYKTTWNHLIETDE